MSVQFSSVQKCDLDDASIWHLNNSKSQEQRTGSVWNSVVLGSRFVLLFCVAITMFLKLGKLIMVTKLGLGHHGFWYLAALWKYTPMPISTVCMIRLLFFLMNPFLTISFRLFPIPVKKGGAQNKDRHTRCEQCTEVRGLCACFYAWIWHCRCCRPAASWWHLCGFLWDSLGLYQLDWRKRIELNVYCCNMYRCSFDRIICCQSWFVCWGPGLFIVSFWRPNYITMKSL